MIYEKYDRVSTGSNLSSESEGYIYPSEDLEAHVGQKNTIRTRFKLRAAKTGAEKSIYNFPACDFRADALID